MPTIGMLVFCPSIFPWREGRGRPVGPPGYHWGWLNGQNASAGEGWINDATGQPLDPRYGDARRDGPRR